MSNESLSIFDENHYTLFVEIGSDLSLKEAFPLSSKLLHNFVMKYFEDKDVLGLITISLAIEGLKTMDGCPNG